MNNLYLIVCMIFVPIMVAVSQPQFSLSTDDNMLIIKIHNFDSQCYAKYDMELQIQSNNINIFLRDTSNQKCKTNCSIDMSININQLPQGNYNVYIFKEELTQYSYAKDARKQIYKKDFKISENYSKSPLSYDISHTSCSPQNENSQIQGGIEVYPNPISSRLTVKFDLKSKADINFKVLNFLGKELISFDKKNLTSGIQTLNIDADNLQPGMYLGKLTASNGQVYSIKLIWSK